MQEPGVIPRGASHHSLQGEANDNLGFFAIIEI